MGDVWEFTTAAPMRPGRAAYAPPASGAPIVVDFGSHHCRAGWAGHAAPLVDFRALVHRPRCKARALCGSLPPLHRVLTTATPILPAVPA